ncbi:hypothetical protein KY358_01200 [Candidatus Woesearchaeota archaeon]|nr:hypothetical protein [Candidatus Woesearchaeota archaeon]
MRHSYKRDHYHNPKRRFTGKPKKRKQFPEAHGRSVESLIEHNWHYANVDLALGLEKIIEWANRGTVSVTAPYLVAAKHNALEYHQFNQNCYTTLTEIVIGLDTKGLFVGKNEGIVMVLHRDVLVTPEIVRSHVQENREYVGYTQEQIDGLIQSDRRLFHIDDIKRGKNDDPFGDYAVVIPFNDLNLKSGLYNEKGFINHPVVLGILGGQQYAHCYFNGTAVMRSGELKLSFQHKLGTADPMNPTGYFVHIASDVHGILCNRNLKSGCLFIATSR